MHTKSQAHRPQVASHRGANHNIKPQTTVTKGADGDSLELYSLVSN